MRFFGSQSIKQTSLLMTFEQIHVNGYSLRTILVKMSKPKSLDWSKQLSQEQNSIFYFIAKIIIFFKNNEKRLIKVSFRRFSQNLMVETFKMDQILNPEVSPDLSSPMRTPILLKSIKLFFSHCGLLSLSFCCNVFLKKLESLGFEPQNLGLPV